MNTRSFLHIVRLSAWYDLAASAPFATPPSFALVRHGLDLLQSRLGFGALPDANAHMVLLANFFGTVVILWALVRLRHASTLFGRYDAVARLAFAAWMIHALTNGATLLLFGFLAIEIAFALLQALPVRRVPA